MKGRTIFTKIKEEENHINKHNTTIKQYQQAQHENETIPAKMKLKRNDTKTEQ
jgi:predicted transcriptional regulator